MDVTLFVISLLHAWSFNRIVQTLKQDSEQ